MIVTTYRKLGYLETKLQIALGPWPKCDLECNHFGQVVSFTEVHFKNSS